MPEAFLAFLAALQLWRLTILRFTVIFVATFVALTFGGYHYWNFIEKLERDHLLGRIQLNLPPSRMRCWMICGRAG